MNVHILQHAPFEGPAHIGTWLRAQGHAITTTRLYAPRVGFPGIGTIDALVIMGGPMSVHDEHLYEWLHEEKAFIEDCIADGKPVLGICLGAQLIATCLGAQVYTASNKEIGWYPVMPTAESRAAQWFYKLFESQPTVLHWHGEKFDIPYDGSLDPLYSEANDHQAFLKGDRVIGLQFHLEATAESIEAMIANDMPAGPATPYVQDAQTLRSGFANLQQNRAILERLLEHWLDAGSKRLFDVAGSIE